MAREPTEEEKTELADLYRRLCVRHGWPIKSTWLADRDTILADIDRALPCLRGLVAEQCEMTPLEKARTHWAFTEESRAESEALREAARIEQEGLAS